MTIVAALVGLALIMVILWEGFEVIILPRRVTRRFRLSRYFFRFLWYSWRTVGSALVPMRYQETWLSFFGPLSNLMMIGVWVGGLITGFALLLWAGGSSVRVTEGNASFITDLYLSGTTFFTLGLGDVVPRSNLARLLIVVESGMGFGFLAIVISYLPALNQTFSRREVTNSLLDARAGSPPCASEMLLRHRGEHGMEELRRLLQEWERWSAEFLEGHLSYPVLAYFRSQHDNQSWLGALTAILDTCALAMVGLEGSCRRQAELTFAMARHAVVDLTLVFRRSPQKATHDRLPPDIFAQLRAILTGAGLKLSEGEAAEQKLTELRQMYEPYVNALATFFRIKLPPWVAVEARMDNWQTSGWEPQGTRFRRADREGPDQRKHF